MNGLSEKRIFTLTSEIWFTSDTHFLHAALMKHYPDRGRFSSIEELTEWQIQEWNARISKRDIVYHIGDFGAWDTDESIQVARRLNGKLHHIPGNHDRKLLKNEKWHHRCSVVHDSISEVNINGDMFVLCHFPMWEWHQMHRGALHIHGHVHGKPTGIPGKIMDVGIDGNGLMPYNYTEVMEHMNSREVRTHHG